jgi:glycosyltransferase involved in cell wall biosynthesis
MSRKFAFVTRAAHPSKMSIIETLSKHLPDFEVDIIHIGDMVRNRKAVILANMFFVFKEYWLEILLRRKSIGECFWRTPYIFKKVKSLVSTRLSPDKYAFSFQYQSLLDGSIAGLPHYIYTDHTHLANLTCPTFKKTDLYSQRWIKLEKTIYHNATLNFTRTNNVSRSIIEDYACPPEKVVCVYAGSNIGTDFVVDQEKYKNKNILFVGFDWERKGGPELVAAFQRVLETHPTARLTIIGCTPKLNVRNCDVVGRVPVQGLISYYARAAVFCLPTKSEPSFPIACVEAFAHGVPVVSTDIEGIPELVLEGETGYLVKCGEVEHLVEVLNELLGNPEKCRTLGENGRRLALEKYNWERVGAEMARHIMATIEAGKR